MCTVDCLSAPVGRWRFNSAEMALHSVLSYAQNFNFIQHTSSSSAFIDAKGGHEWKIKDFDNLIKSLRFQEAAKANKVSVIASTNFSIDRAENDGKLHFRLEMAAKLPDKSLGLQLVNENDKELLVKCEFFITRPYKMLLSGEKKVVHYKFIGKGDSICLSGFFSNLPREGQLSSILKVKCSVVSFKPEADAAVNAVYEDPVEIMKNNFKCRNFNFQYGMADDFKKLWEENEEGIKDVKVMHCGEKEIWCISSVLIARSKYFAENLVVEGEIKKEIAIADMKENVAEDFFQFLHTDRADHIEELAPELLEAAENYRVLGLKVACEKVLVKKISDVETALKLLLKAEEFNAPRLRTSCIVILSADERKTFVNNQDFKWLMEKFPNTAYLLIKKKD